MAAFREGFQSLNEEPDAGHIRHCHVSPHGGTACSAQTELETLMTRTSHLIAVLSACIIAAPIASASELTVTVEGIAKQQGSIMLGLFDEATYNGDGAVNGANLTVEGTSVSVTFEGLEPGEYAVRLYHDVNDDGEMNSNPFGMPTEPYAFSNNAQGRFGPAKWEDAKFSVEADGTAHTITMN
jgi:uncharacterized protein (DUF2141 family)